MTKRPPMAQSPLIALAEQANVAGIQHAILVVRTETGERMVWPLDGSDPDVLIGIMSWAISTILTEIPEDDEE